MNFKDKVVYQIYPKSFCDSDGDGLGDIKGIISKLDYLKGLGVDFIWTTPFFKSPQNDNGYDISDYLSIEPIFGTMEDVEELIKSADECGIGMMFDMVFNHTSTEHEWFKRALAGEEKYQNYYIFKDGSPDKPPTNWISKFGGSAWEYVESLGKWYLHLFDVTQADLNWDNPEVREELKDVIRFWKKKGVKGFRFDVVNLISKPELFEDDYEGDGRRFYTDGIHVHEFLQELVKDTGIDDMITVGEMSSTSIDNCIKYSNPERKELSMTFSFHHLKVDYKDGEKWELADIDYKKLRQLFVDWQVQMQDAGGWNALFWDNHDQPRAVSRFGDDEKYWRQSAKTLATMIHMMRGTPYIYQGDEIGLPNAKFTDVSQYVDVESINYYDILMNQGKPKAEVIHILGERSRDNGRTPMCWNRDKYAGFMNDDAMSNPWVAIAEHQDEANVFDQLDDSDSIYNYYRSLITIRKEYKLISDGKIRFIDAGDDRLIVYERYFDDDDKKMLIICNLASEEISFDAPAEYSGSKILLNNYGKGGDVSESQMKIRPFESYVISAE